MSVVRSLPPTKPFRTRRGVFLPPLAPDPGVSGNLDASLAPSLTVRVYALDTAAVRGGQLTAAVFPGGEILQVPARRHYYEESLAQWRKIEEAPGARARHLQEHV